MAGCRILPQPAIHKLIDSGRLKGSLRRAHARPCPAKPPTQNSKEADFFSTVKPDIDEGTAKEILQEGIEKLHAWGVTATGHFAVGSVVEEIARLANSLKVDLIVIGHHPEGFFARWWTGENHTSLLNRVSCGVLFEVCD
jgi:nucleotide-binding universal stress UspA family protein